MEKKIIHTKAAPAPVGPYSQAVLAGNTLYVSGQIPLDPETGEMVEGDIAKATDRVMKNLKAVLKAAGFDLIHVVKCSIFVKDMNDFAVINEVYGRYFTNMAPARETVEVSNLPKDAGVEISCVAVI